MPSEGEKALAGQVKELEEKRQAQIDNKIQATRRAKKVVRAEEERTRVAKAKKDFECAYSLRQAEQDTSGRVAFGIQRLTLARQQQQEAFDVMYPENSEELTKPWKFLKPKPIAKTRGKGRNWLYTFPEGIPKDVNQWSLAEQELSQAQMDALFFEQEQWDRLPDDVVLEDDDEDESSASSVMGLDDEGGVGGDNGGSIGAGGASSIDVSGSTSGPRDKLGPSDGIDTDGQAGYANVAQPKGATAPLPVWWHLAASYAELSEKDLVAAKPVVFNKPYARHLLREHLMELKDMHEQSVSINSKALFVNVWSALGEFPDKYDSNGKFDRNAPSPKMRQVIDQLLPFYEELTRYRNTVLKAKEIQLQMEIKLAIGLTDNESRLNVATSLLNLKAIMRRGVGQFGKKPIWAIEARRMLAAENGQLPGQLYARQPLFLPLRIAAPPRVGKSATALLAASLAKRLGMVSMYSVSPYKTAPMAELKKKLLRIGWRPVDPVAAPENGGAEKARTRMRFGAYPIDDLPFTQGVRGSNPCNPTVRTPEPTYNDPRKARSKKQGKELAIAIKEAGLKDYQSLDMIIYSSDVALDCQHAGAVLAEFRRRDVVVFHIRDEAQSLAKELKNTKITNHRYDVPPPRELQFLRYYYSNLYGISCNVTATHFPTLLEEDMWGFIGSAQQNVHASLPVVATADEIRKKKTGARFLPKLTKALIPPTPAGYVGVERLVEWEYSAGKKAYLAVGADKRGGSLADMENATEKNELDAMKADVNTVLDVPSPEELAKMQEEINEMQEEVNELAPAAKKRREEKAASESTDLLYIDNHFRDWMREKPKDIAYLRQSGPGIPDDELDVKYGESGERLWNVDGIVRALSASESEATKGVKPIGKPLTMVPMYIGALNNNIRDTGMVSFIKRFGALVHKLVHKDEFEALTPQQQEAWKAHKEGPLKDMDAAMRATYGVAFILFTGQLSKRLHVKNAGLDLIDDSPTEGAPPPPDVLTVTGDDDATQGPPEKYTPRERTSSDSKDTPSALVVVYDPTHKRNYQQDKKPFFSYFFTTSAEVAIKHVVVTQGKKELTKFAVLGFGMLKAGLTVQTYLEAPSLKRVANPQALQTDHIFCPRYLALSTAKNAALDTQLQVAGRAFVDIKGRVAPAAWDIKLLGIKDRIKSLLQYNQLEARLARLGDVRAFEALKEGFGAQFLDPDEFGSIGTVGARRGRFADMLGLTSDAAKEFARRAQEARELLGDDMQVDDETDDKIRESDQDALEDLGGKEGLDKPP